jgi:DNA-binding transcriptional regulator YiaG
MQRDGKTGETSLTAERTLPSIDVTELRRELGLLTEDEIAALADVEVSTVRSWRTERRGPPFTHLGRRPLYLMQSLQRWLKEQEQETHP